ncbi:MAG: flagellar hook-associated protein FlgL [Dehalococcoidales bacterium]|nr:flagellar hook-associated protein FlgL [Dehalococcoidales bacterium]
MRVTNKMMANLVTANLRRNAERLAASHERLSTGRRLNRPSDDPSALSRALSVRRTIGENEQYMRNIDNASGWLSATDVALARVGDLVTRASDLAARGANDTLGAEQRTAMAGEVTQLLEDLLQVANSSHGDDYLFAGVEQGQAPYTADDPLLPTNVTYQGAGKLERTIGADAKMAINPADGGDAFEFAPGRTVFDALISLRDALLANDQATISASLDDLDSAQTHVSSLRAAIGAKVTRLQHAGDQLKAGQVEMQAQLSKDQDLDVAEELMNYSTGETTYKAALGTAAKTLMPSLIDYLT